MARAAVDKNNTKQKVKRLLINSLGGRAFDVFARNYYKHGAAIFMLHRFDTGMDYYAEHTAEQLSTYLELLHKKRFKILSLDELVRHIKNNEPLPEKSVAFTVDDGYFDQLEVSVPVFERFECPATYFIVTDFIDKKVWMWDSKIHYIYSVVDQDTFDLFAQFLPGHELPQRALTPTQVIFALVLHSLSDINKITHCFLEKIGLTLPDFPVKEYAPCSWSDLKSAISSGMSIGAHTLTHPLLSQESEAESRRQIESSFLRLKEELNEVSNVFCYPVGRSADFTEREEGIVSELGFSAAVSTYPSAVQKTSNIYALPRFGFPNNESDLIQYSSWIESAKAKIRKHF